MLRRKKLRAKPPKKIDNESIEGSHTTERFKLWHCCDWLTAKLSQLARVPGVASYRYTNSAYHCESCVSGKYSFMMSTIIAFYVRLVYLHFGVTN